MAKSLRSASKKKTKAIKRSAVFKPVEDARLDRLATAQQAAAALPKVAAEEKAESMDTDVPKISTSGPKLNSKTRRQQKRAGKKGGAKKKTINRF
ncbi:hypothetical protein DM01DRAFT_1404259 [Hesseltinella vesiculosa]|uniref:DUF2423 domain-containing protein n=1 Tax=Hesseltinella vesiculosa TaxID=101127 RepID=A0A1X2GTZ4_9FUNG|nr:hypothetical protein DM01DRAFT_1404259 [Hesseltinella vesiculosa]